MNLATITQLRKWFNAKKNIAINMFVIFDQKSQKDFPINSTTTNESKELFEKYNTDNRYYILNIFSYKSDFTTQIHEKKAMHLE